MAPRSIMNSSSSYLDQARGLRLPSRDEMLRRDPYVDYFWSRHSALLQKAWVEWQETDDATVLPVLDQSIYHPRVREAFEEARRDPSKENLVRDLWEEVSPGVYQCQFFDPDKIGVIRAYLNKASESRIPTRPPHGIVLNRKGFMVDPRSDGYMAMPDFQRFYRDLIDSYMRPLGRLFFPEYIQAEDDSESFAFTIQYQANKDQSIRQHSDASSLTFNINLNMPAGEEFTGSSLYFVDESTGQKNTVNFAPGVAVMHRGATQHAALPIISGERTNMVLWLYGENGRTNSYYPYKQEEQMSREARWVKPVQDSDDRWTPF